MFFALCAVSLSSVVSLGGKRKTRASRDGRTLLARSFASLLMQLRGSIATAVDKCARRRLFVASMRTFVVPSCVGQRFWGGPVRWRVFSDLLSGRTSLFLLLVLLFLLFLFLFLLLVELVPFARGPLRKSTSSPAQGSAPAPSLPPKGAGGRDVGAHRHPRPSEICHA